MAFKMKPSSFRRNDDTKLTGKIFDNYDAAKNAIKNKSFKGVDYNVNANKYTLRFFNKDGKVETTGFTPNS